MGVRERRVWAGGMSGGGKVSGRVIVLCESTVGNPLLTNRPFVCNVFGMSRE